MFFRQLLLLVFCASSALGQVEIHSDVNSNNEIITSILQYLNERNPSYFYQTGSIVQTYIKNNKLEVTSDIDVSCEYPCTGGRLRCESIFHKSSEESQWRIIGTICAPKALEGDEVQKYRPPVREFVPEFQVENNKNSVFEDKKEVVEEPIIQQKSVNQQTPSVTTNNVAEPLPVNHVQCVGCPVDINTNAEGVPLLVNAALQHVESERGVKHVAIKVHRVQQQVVAGIKYLLLVEIAPTVCSKDSSGLSCPLDTTQTSFLCEVEYWEKPWMGFSQIVGNNCTKSQSFTLREPVNTTPKPVHRELEPDFLSDLESQIIPDTPKHQKTNEIQKDKTVQELSKIAANSLGYENYQVTSSSAATLDEKDYLLLTMLLEKSDHLSECNIYMTVNDIDITKSTVDKVSCYDNDHSRHVRQIPGGINPGSKNDPNVQVYLKDGLVHLDKDSPHKTKYKVVDILEVSKQVVSGFLYRIKAEVALSDCDKEKDDDHSQCGLLEGVPSKICNFKVWHQAWLENGRQTNITCENESKEYSFRMRRSLTDEDEMLLASVFEHFVGKYDKKYLNRVEYNYRFGVFKDNLKLIHLLNKYEQGTALYKITKFADKTPEEFSMLHGYRPDLRSDNDIPFQEAKIPQIDLPTSFDWRDKNAVTEVKDQGMCGSCWAFSTTGNVEGQYAIKYKKLLEYSEQELVDCDKLDDGCNGGLMDNAYRTIEKLGGLELEKEYPYKAEDEKCQFNKTKAVVRLSGALNISHDETDMAKWLTQNGPISIAINANAMQFYAGGVSHPFKVLCNPNNLDHGVLIVGYGVHTTKFTKKQVPYWIVKNSWGKSWGENGYYRVYRGDGTCGLNQTPSSGIVA